MVEINNNTLYFPENISFSHISFLYKSFDTLMQYDTIVFDLRKTNEIHAAFVGFLIYLKTEKEKYNGTVRLIMSERIEYILHTLQLNDYFLEDKRSA